MSQKSDGTSNQQSSSSSSFYFTQSVSSQTVNSKWSRCLHVDCLEVPSPQLLPSEMDRDACLCVCVSVCIEEGRGGKLHSSSLHAHSLPTPPFPCPSLPLSLL